MNNGTRTLSPATSFVASMLSTHCLSSCCVAQLFGNRCQIYIYIYTCLCIYFSLSSISDLYISSQKILMKNSSPAEENFIVILKKKDSMINHYSYFCYFHKKKKIIRFKNRWKKSSIDRSIDHGMEEAECSAIKFIRSARRRSSNGRERMDGCGARIVNSNIKIEPVPSTETYSSQNLVAKRRRRVDPPIDNASLRWWRCMRYARPRINNASSSSRRETGHKYPWNFDANDDLVPSVESTGSHRHYGPLHARASIRVCVRVYVRPLLSAPLAWN